MHLGCLKNLIKILKSYRKAMIILTQTDSVSLGSLRFATAELGKKGSEKLSKNIKKWRLLNK